jgi:hypothetical protein
MAFTADFQPVKCRVRGKLLHNMYSPFIPLRRRRRRRRLSLSLSLLFFLFFYYHQTFTLDIMCMWEHDGPVQLKIRTHVPIYLLTAIVYPDSKNKKFDL